MKKILVFIFICTLFMILIGCSQSNEAEEGTLQFVANGEDFIRDGFISKDGWEMSFDHAYIHLANIRAYQSDPPYHADSAAEISGEVYVELEGEYTVDLATGSEDSELVIVDTISAPKGHYNAMTWEIKKASQGPIEGHMLVLIGKAEKDGEEISFKLQFDKAYRFTAGEFVGDERKGFVTEDEAGELEMTFHFDHLFGDMDESQEDHLNVEAIGFHPFAELAEDGKVTLNQAQMEQLWDPQIYNKLLHILPSLGHVGEGHAYSEELE